MVGMLFGVAKADQLAFVTILTGAQEVPPNASPGIGRALVTIDTVTNNRRSKKLFPRSALGTGCAGVAREHNVSVYKPRGMTKSADVSNASSVLWPNV